MGNRTLTWRTLQRAAPRLVSAPAGRRNKGRDESRPGTLKRAPRRIWILLAAILISADAMIAQCSMCRRALVSSVEGQKLARGFNSGILFLLLVPILIFGSVAFLIHRSRRGDARA